MPKEKLTFVGQFGATDIAFRCERTFTPVPTIVRRKHLSFVGVTLGISRIR